MLQESVKQSAKVRSLDHFLPYQLLIKVEKNTENEVKHQKRYNIRKFFIYFKAFFPKSNSKFGMKLDQIFL